MKWKEKLETNTNYRETNAEDTTAISQRNKPKDTSVKRRFTVHQEINQLTNDVQQASDREEVVTPLMLDGTYLSRNYATLGPVFANC